MVSGLTTVTRDRLHARGWFEWRKEVNLAAGIGLFLIIFVVLLPFIHVFPALIIGLGPGLVLFVVWENRTIGIKCPYKKKYIKTNTPWICGNKECEHQNNRADDFPFIYKCERCGTYPKAYQCHHDGCKKLIFFTKDEQRSGYARSAN